MLTSTTAQGPELQSRWTKQSHTATTINTEQNLSSREGQSSDAVGRRVTNTYSQSASKVDELDRFCLLPTGTELQSEKSL